MQFLWFLLIGALAGWIAGTLMKKKSSSLLRNLVVGVAGAYIGGWLFPKLGIHFGGDIGLLVMAAGGAIVLLFVIDLLT
jgi:uncharacterized membrane protein YeaQ/YmgE (transglycosylase-associated protein family)